MVDGQKMGLSSPMGGKESSSVVEEPARPPFQAQSSAPAPPPHTLQEHLEGSSDSCKDAQAERRASFSRRSCPLKGGTH